MHVNTSGPFASETRSPARGFCAGRLEPQLAVEGHDDRRSSRLNLYLAPRHSAGPKFTKRTNSVIL